VFYNDGDGDMSGMMTIIYVKWRESDVLIMGYDPLIGYRVSFPAPFNYEVEVWASVR
jgi:hypothetical protein